MKLTKEKVPVLECIENNILNERIQTFIDVQINDKSEQGEIKKSLPYFIGKSLQINYIANSIHDRLIDTNNFSKARKLLQKTPETTGLLILPKTIYPDFNNVPDYAKPNPKDYPINAVLYSWLSYNEHDSILNNTDSNDYEDEEGRELLIIPIYDTQTTQASEQYYLRCAEDLYATDYSEQEGRCYYGKIHDYVMSFILFYNYTETETKTLHSIDSGEIRKTKINNEKYINNSKNDIEIIDSTYFTNLIRTGEFGVRGHFRVQPCGVNNEETKIIFIDKYKKEGYTRGAKIDRKK